MYHVYYEYVYCLADTEANILGIKSNFTVYVYAPFGVLVSYIWKRASFSIVHMTVALNVYVVLNAIARL